MSAKTVKGLLRKKKWSAEEMGIAQIINWAHVFTKRNSDTAPFSNEVLEAHMATSLEEMDIEKLGIYKHMQDVLSDMSYSTRYNYALLYTSVKSIFSLIRNILAIDILKELITNNTNLQIPERLACTGLEGYQEDSINFLSRANDITDEYIKIVEASHSVNGYNTMLDDIISIHGIKDLALLKLDTSPIIDGVEKINAAVDALNEWLNENNNKDKIALSKKFIHPVLFEKTFPEQARVEQGRQMIKDFSGFSKQGCNLLFRLYCSTYPVESNQKDKA